MPAVTIEKLNNASLDCDTIEAFATSDDLEVTDRKGNTKPTLAGTRAIARSGYIAESSWANLISQEPGLSAPVGASANIPPETDAGTHTDPITSATVPNAGQYVRRTTAADGWEWLRADTLASKADKTEVEALGPPVTKLIPLGPSRLRNAVFSGTRILSGVTDGGETYAGDLGNLSALIRAIGNPLLINAIASAGPVRIPLGRLNVRSGLIVGGMYAWYIDADDVYHGVTAGGGASTDPNRVEMYVGTGQSLERDTDANGAAAITTEPNKFGDRFLMLAGGRGPVIFNYGDDYVPLAPEGYSGLEVAHEVDDVGSKGTSKIGFGEGLYQMLTDAGQDNCRLVALSSAIGSTKYSGLKKGTNVWTAMMNGIQAARDECAVRGWTSQVGVFNITHGEAETDTAQATYEGFLQEWLDDFRTDASAITGQPPRSIVAYYSQISRAGVAAEGVALAQLAKHRANTRDFCLFAPKYQFSYSDGVHLVRTDYYKLGEYLAKARFFRRNGGLWTPLQFVSAVRAGTVVTLTANNNPGGGASHPGPIGPLTRESGYYVFNASNAGFGAGLDGFRVNDPAVDVTAVTITGDQTVQVTLSAEPVAGSYLYYALGPVTGGRIRDADDRFKSKLGNTPLYNPAVADRFLIS